MALGKKKKENEPEPEANLPITLTTEEIEELSWLIKQLVEDGGFDTYWAGALAATGCDYREAIALKQKGCSQPLVYELLR
jgi:hypothetical protein